MKAKSGKAHEPEAKLLGAEDALHDAARLREALRQSERAVLMRVPLQALLDAIDALEPSELQRLAERVDKRLALTHR